jgi:PAS domain S-box-containing protein
MSRDITEYKRSVEALPESEECFRTMMEQCPIGIQILTPDGRIVQVNDAYTKIWGVTLEDVSEYNILQDEQVKRLGITPYIERAFAGETLTLPPFKLDPWKTGGKGRRRWIRSHIYSMKDDNGQIRNVTMIHEDITGLEESRRKSLAISSRYEALLAAMPDIVAEVDENRRYKWLNNAGLGFFGEDAVGREPSYYFEGEHKTNDIVEPLFHGDENVIYVESWQRRKDGEKRLLAWWCKTLKNAAGDLIGAIFTARDITERRRQ